MSAYHITFEEKENQPRDPNIVVNHFHCSVGGKELFKDTQVKFVAGVRYGLVGPNGFGKTSLLKLIEGRQLPFGSMLSVLLVQQEQDIDEMDLSAIEVVLRSNKKRSKLLEEHSHLEVKENLSRDEYEQLLQIQDELASMNVESDEGRARSILYGLGFDSEAQEKKTKFFSGGWRKRIALASAVFMEPHLLILDEPSNHLDLNAVLWLQSYLPKYYNEKKSKTLIVVSHDVEFLDGICNRIVHIDDRKLCYYSGGYYEFLHGLDAKRAEHDTKYNKLQKEIHIMKTKQHMSKKQVSAILENRARKEGRSISDPCIEKRTEYIVNFPIESSTSVRESECLIRLTDVTFGFPGKLLFKDVSMSIWADTRMTIVGRNGEGKSTLLNLMEGKLDPHEGSIERRRNLKIGRYNQHFVDGMPMDVTPVDYLQSLGLKTVQDARKRLGSFGLDSKSHVNKMVKNLSGGEKSRLALAAISMNSPQVLLLDEPTNHLDIESIEALAKAINEYRGGVVVVTHDARLIRETELSIWLVGDGAAKKFEGDLDDYKEYVIETLQVEENAREEQRIAKKASRIEAVKPAGGESIEPEEMSSTKKNNLTSLFAKLDRKKKSAA